MAIADQVANLPQTGNGQQPQPPADPMAKIMDLLTQINEKLDQLLPQGK